MGEECIILGKHRLNGWLGKEAGSLESCDVELVCKGAKIEAKAIEQENALAVRM